MCVISDVLKMLAESLTRQPKQKFNNKKSKKQHTFQTANHNQKEPLSTNDSTRTPTKHNRVKRRCTAPNSNMFSASSTPITPFQYPDFESGKFMNNPDLQKYVPLYLKNLIISSNLYSEFQAREAREISVSNTTTNMNAADSNTDTDAESISTVHNYSPSSSSRFFHTNYHQQQQQFNDSNQTGSSIGDRIGTPRLPESIASGGSFWETRSVSVGSSLLSVSSSNGQSVVGPHSAGSILGF
ncbi:unnamed protein product [Ambrosiozyma monospora]|uniref:Unnamed protein product n=1 Tax=Ambrosiozyma monospora TaxID=43982 RepID=A0ACB5T5Y9_AMBMO|nr:unnamed protein product [Ambrosiozyma monospora]